MNQSALIRPDWTPATIALMVVGFLIFWPLGLAVLAYIIFGDRLKSFRKSANSAVDGVFSAFGRNRPSHGGYSFSTGNVAFDDWRDAELSRLDEERRKLDEMRREFDDYVSELRRAKDQEEFDRFMRDRKSSGGSVPGFPQN